MILVIVQTKSALCDVIINKLVLQNIVNFSIFSVYPIIRVLGQTTVSFQWLGYVRQDVFGLLFGF